MNKKGFTLIELLAVIIILAILMIIAIPNVLNTLNETKKNSFETEVKSIVKAAEQQYMIDAMVDSKPCDCYDKSNLDITSLSSDFSFKVIMDENGKVINVEAVKINESLEGTGSTINNISVIKKENLNELSCNSGSKTKYLDGTIATVPELGELVPIKWNGSKWLYADVTEEWYDYADKNWANAVVLSSSAGTKNVGDEIKESDIDLWFVWVPRYEYKLPISSIGTTDTPNAIDIKFISSQITTPSEGYSFHPGFKFGNEWKNGIWIGKFESTSNNINSNAVQLVKIKADVASWRNVSVLNAYNSSLNTDSLYSLTSFDSHMTRYTEWTTISYLSNSIYGSCGSSTSCMEISKNSDTSYLTGAGAYQTNINQSTTGNITGVYDINGGANEYVMGFLKDAIIVPADESEDGNPVYETPITTDNKYNDFFTSNTHDFYREVYIYDVITELNGNSSMNGIFKELMSDATKNYNWFGDRAHAVSDAGPYFALGGCWNDGDSGAFSSFHYDGGPQEYLGFRVALIHK